MSISEIKKNYEQKQVEKSDNKLTESLFSNDPYAIDNSSSIKILKLDKNKFVSVINEKKIKPVIKSIIKPKKIENKCYDLNDYDYDCDFDFLIYD
jgi:hypothetical protein